MSRVTRTKECVMSEKLSAAIASLEKARVAGSDPIRWTVYVSGFLFVVLLPKKKMIDVGAVGISRSFARFRASSKGWRGQRELVPPG